MKIDLKRISVYTFELVCLTLIILLPFSFFVKPLMTRSEIIRYLNKEPLTEARLFQVIKRQRHSIGIYDDVGLGEIDHYLYYLEIPPGSKTSHKLNKRDFFVIDYKSLKEGFCLKTDGYSKCQSCLCNKIDYPFKSVIVKTGYKFGNDVLLIEGFERTSITWYVWLSGILLFFYSVILLFTLLTFIWNEYLEELVNAYAGVPALTTISLILYFAGKKLEIGFNAVILFGATSPWVMGLLIMYYYF